ncbi:hypothetical protein HU200_059809 [Digitaria exilis]|uniref:Uncharacterized protein n=1 Tax=Digitaria exilis TaxID=1010633 RepID=A0A835AFI4_9POAL|nr:hypothetical protein HU200_059809 [Digitaria exilis]
MSRSTTLAHSACGGTAATLHRWPRGEALAAVELQSPPQLDHEAEWRWWSRHRMPDYEAELQLLSITGL